MLGGLFDSPTIFALKKILKVYKPDFCIIVEPWTCLRNVFHNWLYKIGMEIFQPTLDKTCFLNIWCLYSNHLSLTIISFDEQRVTFSFLDNKNIF